MGLSASYLILGGKRWTLPPDICPKCRGPMAMLKSAPPASQCIRCKHYAESDHMHNFEYTMDHVKQCACGAYEWEEVTGSV